PQFDFGRGDRIIFWHHDPIEPQRDIVEIGGLAAQRLAHRGRGDKNGDQGSKRRTTHRSWRNREEEASLRQDSYYIAHAPGKANRASQWMKYGPGDVLAS